MVSTQQQSYKGKKKKQQRKMQMQKLTFSALGANPSWWTAAETIITTALATVQALAVLTAVHAVRSNRACDGTVLPCPTRQTLACTWRNTWGPSNKNNYKPQYQNGILQMTNAIEFTNPQHNFSLFIMRYILFKHCNKIKHVLELNILIFKN